MSNYLNSDNVKVFPAAKERHCTINDVAMSRLLTEFNLANIMRQIIGESQGFVISANKDDKDESIIVAKFNLFGYYFDIRYVAENTNDSIVDVYAALDFDNADGAELKQDEDNKYKGLIVLTVPSGASSGSTKEHTIRLFSYKSNLDGSAVVVDGNSVVVHPQDKFLFATEALPIGGIDGKPKQ
jgi:hypothetical protein